MSMKTTLKTLIAALFALASVSVSAQSKGDMAAGANFNFGFGNAFGNKGIGLKYQYNFTDNLRIEPSFNYFFEKYGTTIWDITADMHYLFKVGRFNLYPLAGLSYMKWISHVAYYTGFFHESRKSSEDYLNFVIGGGADYRLGSNWLLNAELRGKIGEYDARFNLSCGVAYLF